MAEFFKLLTVENTWLSVDLPTRWMLHAKPEFLKATQAPVVLIRLAARPHLGVLAALDEDPELIYPITGHLRSMLAVQIEDDPQAGLLSFLHPLSHNPIRFSFEMNEFCHCSLTESPLAPVGWVSAHEVPIVEIGMVIQARAKALEAVFTAPTLVNGLVACLQREKAEVSRTVLEAITFVIPIQILADFGEVLLKSPDLMMLLLRAFPEDVWINEGLPALASRYASPDESGPRTKNVSVKQESSLLSRLFFSRRPATAAASRPAGAKMTLTGQRTIPLDYDHLASSGLYGRTASFGHTLNLFTRSRIKPSKQSCIIATARNEGLNLIEWVAYHRCIGVEAIFLYSNNNDDASEQLLAALAQAGIIWYFDNRVGATSPQQKAYGQALTLNVEVLDYAWAAIIDLDEFLVFNPNTFDSWSDFLSWQEGREVDAIALNWVMIGSDENPRRLKVPMTRRFTRQLGANEHIKSVFRPQKFSHSGPHFPHANERCAYTFNNASGKPHVFDARTEWDDARALSRHPDMSRACIFHYFFKSADEYIWKFARYRGDVNLVQPLALAGLTDHFVRSYIGQTKLDAATTDWPQRCAPGLADEIGYLRSLPGVAEAQAAIDSKYNELIEHVRKLAGGSKVLNTVQPEGSELLHMLDADRL